MELILQYAHGMKGISVDLCKDWGETTVILSPRDIEYTRLIPTAKEIRKSGGKLLFDPQLYNPRADHKRLTSYDYWPSNYSTINFLDPKSTQKTLSIIKEINDSIESESIILPGIYCSSFSQDWINFHSHIINEANIIFPEKDLIATICLSGEVIRNEENLEKILNVLDTWEVESYYIIAEHSKPGYLSEDPLWLSNLLIFCGGIKLKNKKVIVGYSNHQMVCLASAKVDAIASGTWLNVRTFSTSRFDQPNPDSESRRTMWYYCPHSLSEYKIVFLDLAKKANILNEFESNQSSHSYASLLFSGIQPSNTGFNENMSFKHYLNELRIQCLNSTRKTYIETMDSQVLLLENAYRTIERFQSYGIRGQQRDFRNAIDVNLAALTFLGSARGFALTRSW